MPTLTPAQVAFLDNPFVATVTTVRRDGSLHSTVVWVGVEDGDVVFNTLRGRAKERHLSANSRVSLLVVDPANAYHWLAVDGTAELDEAGAEERIDRLSQKYLGRDTYPWRSPEQRWVGVRIRAERIDTAGIEG